MCETIAVMYAGRIVEDRHHGGGLRQAAPSLHAGLLNSSPRRARKGERLPSIPGLVPPPGSAGLRLQLRRSAARGQPSAAAPNVPALRQRAAPPRLLEPHAMTPLHRGPGPVQVLPCARRQGAGARGERCEPVIGRGRDTGHRGRVGLRKVDPGPPAAAAHRALRGQGSVRAARIFCRSAPPRCARGAATSRSSSRIPMPRSTRA